MKAAGRCPPAAGRRPAAALLVPALPVMLLAMLLAAGCGSGQTQQRRYCTPTPGMTTKDLAACGCLMHDNGALAGVAGAREAGGPDVQSVIIVNYICPLGERGVARVSVVNGVADAVYY